MFKSMKFVGGILLERYLNILIVFLKKKAEVQSASKRLHSNSVRGVYHGS